MQLKKLLLTNIFLIGSIFLVAGCHGYYKGNSTVKHPSIEHTFIEHPFIKLPFIEGSILEGDIIDASCSIQGLDESGKVIGKEYNVIVNKTPSIVYRQKSANTPKLQITCNGKTKSNEQGIAQIVVNRGVTPQKVKIPIIDIFSSGNTIGNTEIGSNLKGVDVADKQQIPFHLSINHVENAPTDVIYAIISDKANAEAIKVTPNVDVYDLFKYDPVKDVETTFTVCMIAQGGDVKDCTAKTSIKNSFPLLLKLFLSSVGSTPSIKNHILAVSTFKATLKIAQSIVNPNNVITTTYTPPSGLVIGAVATSSTVSKEPQAAKWGVTTTMLDYTIRLPSTYKKDDPVNFGVKVSNGDGKYLVISNGKNKPVFSTKIVGNRETDVYVRNIESLIQNITPSSSKQLYICVLDQEPIWGKQCSFGLALTVSVTPIPKSSLTTTTGIFDPTTIGYSIRSKMYIAKAVGADYTITLPSTYQQGDTVNFGVKVSNGDGKYLVVSNGTDAVSSRAISENSEQEVEIDDISKLLTNVTPGSSKQLYLCVLDSATTSGKDCTDIHHKLAKLTVSLLTQ